METAIEGNRQEIVDDDYILVQPQSSDHNKEHHGTFVHGQTSSEEPIVVEDTDDDEGSGDESDSASDSNDDFEECSDTFFDLDVWEKIGKNLEDFTIEDITKLEFKTHNNCLQFYRMYAKVKGFGIRLKHPNISKVDGHITSQLIWCNREGYRSERYLEKRNRKRKERRKTRCGCRALINFKWNYKSDTWYVTRFIEEHNHDLIPMSQVPFVRSQRQITEADKNRIKSLIDSGVRPSVVMRNMADYAGGLNKVGFLASDLYNTCDRFKKEEIKDGDIETVMAFLLGKQSSDPTFFLAHTRDQNNGIDKMFWCDGICRKNYKAFGTVIAFDTTYKVNAYKKPFVVIVGVNHHRKTVPFGVALITNEKEETYVWVLQQLLRAGDNVAPYTVVTDGDLAMANAIKTVFPHAHHRLCLWHLMRNIKINSNKRFCSGFMKCVDGCSTPEEFEEAWEELMQAYNVRQLKWAKQLYENKEKWAEAFMHGQFYAGMRSTQRCESMNSTLKTVLTKKILLYRFVQLYDKVLNKIRFEEDHDDYNSTHTFPVIRGILPEIKAHAARTYTSAMYALLCKEMEFESSHIVKETERDLGHMDGPTNTYWLNDCVNKNSTYIVLYNTKEQIMCCCCAKLESIGIPCRHMFAVMKYEGMVEIPSGCTLKRWTVKAKSHLEESDPSFDLDKNDDERAANGRFAFLSSLSNQICKMASTSYDRSMWLKDKLAKMLVAINKEKTQRVPVDDDDTKDVKGKKKKGNKRAKEGERIGKKRNVSETEVELEDGLGGSRGNEDINSTVVTEFGPGFSFIKLLLSRIPKTYSSGQVSEAKDCYEVSVFHKDKTVFDWEPQIPF